MSETISKSRYARLPSFKTMTEEDIAVVSKLVKRKEAGGNGGTNRALDVPDVSVLGRIASRTASSNNDAKNLFQVLPDMDLARSILVSAILSPTDMVTTKLNYTLEPNKLDDNLTGPMLRVIRDYFDNTYKIKKFLPDMLSDALFMKGSYPLLVMPETSIDYSINSNQKVTLESVRDEVTSDGWYRPYGVLGVPTAKGEYVTSFENLWDYQSQDSSKFTKDQFVAFESFTDAERKQKVPVTGKVYVTDNPAILSNPKLVERLRKQRQADIYGRRLHKNRRVPSGTTTGMEANANLAASTPMSLAATEKLFYANRPQNHAAMQTILTPAQLDRQNLTNPLVMHLPSEAVIPVHVPGDVRHHIGYFVLIDVNGNPLSIEYRDDYYTDIRASLNSDPSMAGQLLNMARRGTTGNTGWGDGEIDQMQRAYQQSVETDLLNRLRSGAMTGEYQLANCTEVYRLMFARSLAAKHTMLLYVPAELMIYIAFDYNEYGVGKSLLEDGKILGSLRSVLLFASTMAAVRNAVDGKNISITVPEEDENPYETVAFMLGEHAKVNKAGFPIGETHPVSLVTHLQNAGTVISVQGNTAFPEAKFDVESRDGIHKTIDRDLDEDLRKRHIQTFGLTPETMDGAQGPDFATTVVNQHLMLLKRVIQHQDEFQPFLTDFVRRFTLNSGMLCKELLEIVQANKKFLPKEYKENMDEFVNDFIELLSVELPSPETNRLEDQMRSYQAYSASITEALDAYLKAEAIDGLADQGMVEHLESIKASIISMFQRRYLREKNILPELDIFNTVSEEEGPAFNLLKESEEHLDGVVKSVKDYVRLVIRNAKKRQKEIEKLEAEKAELEGGAGGTDDGLGGSDDFPDDDSLNEEGAVTDDGLGNMDGLDGELDDAGDGGGLDAEPAETDTAETDAGLTDPAETDTGADSFDIPDVPEATGETTPAEDDPATEEAQTTDEPETEAPAEEEEETIDLDIPDVPAEDDDDTPDTEPEPDQEESEPDADLEPEPEEEEEVDIDIPDEVDEDGKPKKK